MSRLSSVSITHALVSHERYRQLLDIEKRLAAAEAERDGLRLAGDEMASDLDTLLGGGVEMKPVASGPVTFEALVMLIQTMAANRDAWRRAAAAGSGEEEEATGG